MDIDQRLEKLTATVEMLTQVQASHDDNLNRLFALQAKNEEAQAKNELAFAQLMESMHPLARIAQLHDRRLSDLEDGA